jgi:hypothetical protein
VVRTEEGKKIEGVPFLGYVFQSPRAVDKKMKGAAVVRRLKPTQKRATEFERRGSTSYLYSSIPQNI